MSEYKERENMDSMSEMWTYTYDRTENFCKCFSS